MGYEVARTRYGSEQAHDEQVRRCAMKGINWEKMLQLGTAVVVFGLLIVGVFWLSSFGPVKEAAARLAQVNVYSDYGHPAGSAFTYQGQLKKYGNPVNGACDFRFSLWDAASGGTQVGPTQYMASVPVNNGLFTVQLDFGASAFGGDARWLEVAARCAGDASYVTLSPRQAITPAPYALYALASRPSPYRPAILILEDDFDRSMLNPFQNYWTTEWVTATTGIGYIALDGNNSWVLLGSGYGGAGSATLYSLRQFSVSEGMLIFEAIVAAYEDNQVCYGDCQPRGLANGADRSNAIEFVSYSGTAVKARTVRNNAATETVYYIPGSYPQNSVYGYRAYQIMATTSEVRFYLDGRLIAVHTTNIPTVPLNPYFDTSYSGSGNVVLIIDRVSFEIVP